VAPEDCSVTVACFTNSANFCAGLDFPLFEKVCRLALASGDLEDRNWRRAVDQLRKYIDQAPHLVFPEGAFLINLGTSWWLPNYFLNIRTAKAHYGIKYVPLVYDCIPIVAGEHCGEELTRQFIAWAMGVFEHADHILAISRTTAADVVRVAEHLGRKIAPPTVVELDASFGAVGELAAADLQAAQLFLKHDLRAGEYVLFVATVESRKNHLLAFSAWVALLKKFGVRRVPKLVCVGKKGWLNEAIYAKLETSSLLRQKVVMLSGIADAELQKLYRDCLFTIFPSLYEGWGLPVTESRCFGKVALSSSGSSLPEAGGDFADYYHAQDIYPAHAIIRKSLGEMMRKLSVTSSQ
jgi:glycosyltransferase involved in cell wall biosynthesis